MEQTSPVSGKLFPCQAGACRAPGSGFPERSPSWLGAGGSWVFSKDNFLVSVLTSIHTQEGTGVASEGAPARGTSVPGSPAGDGGQRERLRRPRAGGSERVVGGGGPRALTSSAIFQTFDPFRKARCSPAAAAAARPRRPGRQRVRRPAAGPSHHLPRAVKPPPRPPGSLTAARAPPGPRRTPPAPLSRRPAPAPRGRRHRRRSPQRPRTHSANLSRCHRVPAARVAPCLALPPGRCSGATAVLPLPPPPPLGLVYTPDSGRGLAVSP